MKIQNILFPIFLIFLITIGLFLLDSKVIEPNSLVVKNETFAVPNWNENLNGMKIAVIADLHIGSPFVDMKRVNKIIDITNSENPDLIFLLGDFDAVSIEKSKITKEEIQTSLKRFKSKYGVFAILGNHDYAPSGIEEIFDNTSVKLLLNQSKNLTINGTKLKITGFEDLWQANVDINKVLREKNSKLPTIVLSHNPDLFVKIPNFVSLTLSGHTHGGEIVLPFAGSPFVPSGYGQRFRKGYVVENNKHLYVSGGVATTSGFRFLNPPEISFIKLYTQNKSNKVENTRPLLGFKNNYIPFYINIMGKLGKKIL